MQYNKKVILFPEKDSVWEFWDVCNSAGGSVIDEWFDAQGFEAADGLRATLKALRRTAEPQNWTAFRHYLKGESQRHKIWEIGFRAGGKQYRVLGIFNGTKRAALLCGCYHKGRVYSPARAIDTAIERAKNVKNGKAELRVRKF